MLRTNITQEQCALSKRNELVSRFSREQSSLMPLSIIKIMMKIMKTKSNDNMDVETQIQFSKIADAIIRMAEEIRE